MLSIARLYFVVLYCLQNFSCIVLNTIEDRVPQKLGCSTITLCDALRYSTECGANLVKPSLFLAIILWLSSAAGVAIIYDTFPLNLHLARRNKHKCSKGSVVEKRAKKIDNLFR